MSLSRSRRACRASVVLIAVSLASASACSVIGPPTVHVPGRVIGPEGGGGPVSITPQPPSATPSYGTERRACRTSPRPSGWIAVAYVPAPTECPRAAGADVEASGAILVRYAGLPMGAELDVCADQGTPRGWSRGRAEVDEAQRCPGAGRGSESAIRRIRRVH